VAAERQAMADLGFLPVERDAALTEVDGISEEPSAYVLPLDDAVEWEAHVVLSKQYGTKFGATVRQHPPSAGLAHRPTEQLIRELKRHRPGEGVEHATTRAVDRDDLPPDGYAALARLEITGTEEIPTVVAETVRAVREVYLPLVRNWADVDLLIEIFDGQPPSRPARRLWLERRVVLHHLRGDADQTSAALDELEEVTGSTGIEALDVADRAFVDGMRTRLGRPTQAQEAEQAQSVQLTAAMDLTTRIGELQGEATAEDGLIHVVVAVSGDVLDLELDPEVMGMTARELSGRVMAVLAAARADALRQVSDAMGVAAPNPSWDELRSGAPVDLAAPLPPIPDVGS
jgi:DNA-binding protein YbaB